MSQLTKTVLSLYDDGHVDVSFSLIAQAHAKRGYNINFDGVAVRRAEIINHLFLLRREVTVHPITTRFLKDGGSKKIHFDVKPVRWFESMTPSVPRDRDPDFALAVIYLPIGRGNETAGFRFVTGRNDYLSFVWAHVVKASVRGKLERQTRKDIQALENKHWPTEITLRLIGEMAAGLPQGINGVGKLPEKPKQNLIDLREGVASILKSWGNNFGR